MLALIAMHDEVALCEGLAVDGEIASINEVEM